MLQVQQLTARHISMMALSLYSYSKMHQPFGGRFIQVRPLT